MVSFSLIDDVLQHPGVSLWCIPAAFLLALYPNVKRFLLIHRTIGFDFQYTRKNLARLKADENYNYLVPYVERLEGCHANGYEILPLYISSIFAGHIARLDPVVINTVTLAFFATRILFTAIYINQEGDKLTKARMAVWWSSLALPFYLIIESGNALARQHL